LAFFVMVDQHLPVWTICLEYGLFTALLLYERYFVKLRKPPQYVGADLVD
jgi:hypothetical protein